VDLALADDANLEIWVAKLVQFLREWSVPKDTYFVVFPPDWVEGTEGQRVNVFESKPQ
jgi:hypothetical protein